MPAINPTAPSPKLPTFKSVDAYESYVRTSGVSQLPAAVERVKRDQVQLSAAYQARDARKGELGYDRLEAAKAEAAAKLDAANHPLRAQASELRAQLPDLTRQAGEASAEISRLQTEISQAQVNQSAAMDNPSYGAKTTLGALAGLALSTAAYASNQSLIANNQKRIQTLVTTQARLQTEIITKTTTAAALDAQPAAPEVLKPYQDALASANQALGRATEALKPQANAADAAQATTAADTAERDRLADLDRQLHDYDARFPATTRMQLWMGNHAWKQQLDAFWQGGAK